SPGSSQLLKRYALQGGALVSIGVPGQPFPSSTLGQTVAAGEGAIAVGQASGGGTVKVYSGPGLATLRTLTPFGASWTGGVTVAVYSDFLAVGRGIGTADVNVYRMSDLSPVTTVQPQPTQPNPTAPYA